MKIYPSDRGGVVEEANEAEAWRFEVDDAFLTPMARINGQDFYVFEPCMLRDGTVVMPHRWFTCPSQNKEEVDGHMFVKIWRLVEFRTAAGVTGWRVLAFGDLEVDSDMLFTAFPVFIESSQRYKVPDPRVIIGESVNTVDEVLHYL